MPCRFQSHAGSIEGSWAGWRMNLSPAFQSHAGSIEVGHPAEDLIPIRGFNPTLVRLRNASCIRPGVVIPCFNPTLVRLRQGLDAVWGVLKWFQSHAGSIEAVAAIPARVRRAPVSIPRWFD